MSRTKGHLMETTYIFSLRLFFLVFPLIQPTENATFFCNIYRHKYYRSVRWEYRNNVQLDKMAKWIKSTISTFHNPAKVSRGCTQSHADPRAPLSCRATEGVEARYFGSFLVSQVPKVADHHHHIWAAAAWNDVCPDPTQPCSNSALQVFDCYHPILTLICCQK